MISFQPDYRSLRVTKSSQTSPDDFELGLAIWVRTSYEGICRHPVIGVGRALFRCQQREYSSFARCVSLLSSDILHLASSE